MPRRTLILTTTSACGQNKALCEPNTYDICTPTIEVLARRTLPLPARACVSSSIITCALHNFQVLAVHDSEEAGSDRGGIAWHLAYDLVYLDDRNRESEVPEADVRAVQDARHRDNLLTLHQTKETPGQAGDSESGGGMARAMGAGGMSPEEVSPAEGTVALGLLY